ncbi:hypothetical protein GY21_05575 [Cryobacterium roopkundense]|uniref:Uncharacterized protein n=1 Tax=Cryobacterium roopkundense TaxID=1001240 RepID=A0A099JM47_9MICO|nr:hypothetical protein [Cryobacterium roopkundense]KGJ79266.1 hypothetical protein GY21_05575 [Cryobacterium roopkundense]MBB5643689.1 hypothetical protein [Cryobacterium roopkundense]
MVANRVAPNLPVRSQIANGTQIELVLGWSSALIKDEDSSREFLMNLWDYETKARCPRGISMHVMLRNGRTDHNIETVMLGSDENGRLSQRLEFATTVHRAGVEGIAAVEICESFSRCNHLIAVDNGNANNVERSIAVNFETLVNERDWRIIVCIESRELVVNVAPPSTVKKSSPRQSVDIWGITPHRQE